MWWFKNTAEERCPTYILLRHLSPPHQCIDQLSQHFLVKRHASLALAGGNGHKVEERRNKLVQLDRFTFRRIWDRHTVRKIVPDVCRVERVEVMQSGGNKSWQVWRDDAWKGCVYRIECLFFPSQIRKWPGDSNK